MARTALLQVMQSLLALLVQLGFKIGFIIPFLLYPDKICDQISDAVLDAHLKQDPDAKVACGEYIRNKLLSTTCYTVQYYYSTVLWFWLWLLMISHSNVKHTVLQGFYFFVVVVINYGTYGRHASDYVVYLIY